MQQNHSAPPVNQLPPAVILLAVALVAAEGFLYLQSLGFLGGVAGLDGRSSLIREFWLPGLLQSWMLETGRFEPEYLKLYLTYVFVHGGFTHTLFTVVFVLALGNFVGQALGWFRFLLLFFVPAVFGAVTYGFVGDSGVLLGGMPGAYGLIGAFTWLMWVGVIRHGIGEVSPFAMIGFLVVFRLVMSGLYGWRWDTIADWSGFITGFGLMFVLIPGGRARLLRMLRRR